MIKLSVRYLQTGFHSYTLTQSIIYFFGKIESSISPLHLPPRRGQKHLGHKMHIATDTNGVIKKVIVTTASTHDSTQFDALTEDEEIAIFADSGYMSTERKKKLREKGIFNGIVERRVRGQSKLRAKQSRNNKRFAKLRGLVELPFAFMKHHINFKETRYVGLEKNQEHFCLIAACANLRRVPKLMKTYG